MFCGNCGTEIRPGANFCAKCGAPVPAPEAPPKKEPDARQSRMSLDDMLELASQYEAAGDHKQQLVILQSAAELYPDDPGVFNRMGIAYRLMGNFSEAIKCYTEAFRRDPENGVYYSNLGICLLCADRFEKSLEWFERALPLLKKNNDPSCATALANYAYALAKSGYAENAVRCLKEAAQLGYPHVEAMRKRMEAAGVYFH